MLLHTQTGFYIARYTLFNWSYIFVKRSRNAGPVHHKPHGAPHSSSGSAYPQNGFGVNHDSAADNVDVKFTSACRAHKLLNFIDLTEANGSLTHAGSSFILCLILLHCRVLCGSAWYLNCRP